MTPMSGPRQIHTQRNLQLIVYESGQVLSTLNPNIIWILFRKKMHNSKTDELRYENFRDLGLFSGIFVSKNSKPLFLGSCNIKNDTFYVYQML